MAKRFAVLLAVLALMLAAAVPAMAQQQSSATGSISGAPAGADSAKQSTIKGVFSVKEGGFSFVTDRKTGQEYYLAGVIGVDPEATAGKTVIAKGDVLCGYDGPVYGCSLGVSSIKPIGHR